MIDLHIHTINSDGTDTVSEVLEKATKINLEALSITDHNSVSAYFDLDIINAKKIYKGEIIVGCEFTTSYKGRLIEILGYNFDYKKISKYLEKHYNKDAINLYSNTIYNRFINKMKELNFKCSLEPVKNYEFNTEFVEKRIYQDIIKYKENLERIDEELSSSYNLFLRKGLSNPESIFYINHASLKPQLSEILNLIHDAGGIAFLAHPYQYGFDDLNSILTELYSKYKIEGIECYHSTFSESESKNLLKFAKDNNLLISGGSDYHGTNKINHNLGTGNNNLKITKEILSCWHK